MEFGICFKGDIDSRRTVAIVRQAEAAGFGYTWFFDSHILWPDPYPVVALCMEHTENMRFGPLVTNPKVRDWSVAASLFAQLSKISDGRMDMAVGRGDSSMRVMGKKPANLANMSDYIDAIRAMTRGENYSYPESPNPVLMDWVGEYEIPVWVAAYGPKALKAAGEKGDGLVVQLADPGLCQWFSSQAISAGEAMGRDMKNYRILSCAPVWVGDYETGVEQTKWFPALVGNHVADIVEKYGKDTNLVPESLTNYIDNRRAGGAGGDAYDYRQHADKDSDNTYYITPEITQSFSIIGSAKDHVEKLKELESVGVTQFTIYLTNGSEEKIVAEYAEHVIPYFKD